jgi:hypothetical protein
MEVTGLDCLGINIPVCELPGPPSQWRRSTRQAKPPLHLEAI